MPGTNRAPAPTTSKDVLKVIPLGGIEEVGENSMWGSHLKDWNTPEMRERISKLYPMRRIGRPEDIANAVLFMASDVSSFVIGQTLSVSGGYTMM